MNDLVVQAAASAGLLVVNGLKGFVGKLAAAQAKQALLAWNRKRQRELKLAREEVWTIALNAQLSGDPELAAAEVSAVLGASGFCDAYDAVVAKMGETRPCPEAHVPLGLLVAMYTERKPDTRFRRVASLLCDLSPEQVGLLRDFVNALKAWPVVVKFSVSVTEKGEFEIKDTRRANFAVAGGKVPWSSIVLWAPELDSLLALMHDHAVLDVDGVAFDLAIEHVCLIATAYFDLLATLLAEAPSAQTFPRNIRTVTKRPRAR